MIAERILWALCCCMLLMPQSSFAGGTIGRTIGVNCSACHAPNGDERNAIPSLEGRSARQIESALLAFKSGRRPATIMDRIARGYTDNEIAAVAAYFANLR
jgi:sulfide dehydrogenase cytochrome subunit